MSSVVETHSNYLEQYTRCLAIISANADVMGTDVAMALVDALLGLNKAVGEELAQMSTALMSAMTGAGERVTS